MMTDSSARSGSIGKRCVLLGGEIGTGHQRLQPNGRAPCCVRAHTHAVSLRRAEHAGGLHGNAGVSKENAQTVNL
jgi:hypothetical protein